MLIACKPRGVCSWHYVLDGYGFAASVDLKSSMNEHGALEADGTTHEVRKQGVLSGHWTLERAGEVVASAHKTSAFKRTFKIHCKMGALKLRPESAIKRAFVLEHAGEEIAYIAPEHAFTRRASMKIFPQEYDAPAVVFAFWLVALTWRRAQSGGGGAA